MTIPKRYLYPTKGTLYFCGIVHFCIKIQNFLGNSGLQVAAKGQCNGDIKLSFSKSNCLLHEHIVMDWHFGFSKQIKTLLSYMCIYMYVN